MTLADWEILGIIFGIATPVVVACVVIWVKLNTIAITADHISEKQEKHQEEFEKLWRMHNHQESRIYVQDRVLSEVVKKCKIDLTGIDFAPKMKPHHDVGGE